MQPYPYQTHVYETLMTGKSVILQAPTGAGKTCAALYPFLRSWHENGSLPRKCIYAVPMRILANQFKVEYEKLVNEYGFIEEMKVAIQTGEHSEDRQFEADLIFATIDQVLSSFLMRPYSLPRRLSNLNAGAVSNAYLVFDEFHLFDPVSTLPTTLEMLKMLRGTNPFVLMTATFSQTMLAGLAKQLDAVVIPANASEQYEMQSLHSQQKTRRYHVHEAAMNAGDIIAQHKSRSLVVCNVVDRAHAMYRALRNHPDLNGTQVVLLHSRFLKQDRQQIEARIREVFAKGKHDGSWIVVATQAIEVGLNITSENLHTELAPANAILQRAGRCARYADEVGDVHIYTQALRRDEVIALSENPAPYMKQEEIIKRTTQAFINYPGVPMTFTDEQAVVSCAHGEPDEKTLFGLSALQAGHQGKMHSIMDGLRDVSASDLIRAINSQPIVIHNNPAELRDAPFTWQTFSLHPGTLLGQVNHWEKTGVLANHVWALQDAGDENESGQSAYQWKPVNTPHDVKGSVLTCIHPDLASYDATEGLRLSESGEFCSQQESSKGSSRPVYYYKLETYQTHFEYVYRAFQQRVWPKMETASNRLAHTLGWEPRLLALGAHLVVLLHDVGKLDCGWQDWVRAYQAGIGQPVVDGEVYAHTDYNRFNATHDTQQRQMPHRPPHAVEGATAIAPYLVRVLQGNIPLVKAVFTAIARHHGAFTRQGHPYQLEPQARDAINDTLTVAFGDTSSHVQSNELWSQQTPTEEMVRDMLVSPEMRKEILPYMLLARVLRLSDQLGTGEGAR